MALVNHCLRIPVQWNDSRVRGGSVRSSLHESKTPAVSSRRFPTIPPDHFGPGWCLWSFVSFNSEVDRLRQIDVRSRHLPLQTGHEWRSFTGRNQTNVARGMACPYDR